MKLTIHCSFLLLSLAGITTVSAQSAYSVHTLEKGETLSILAKSYHTTVGDIMRLNSMNAQSQLHTGDKIKIPAGGATVVAPPATPAVESSAPATTIAKTHVVATGETLFHISQVYKVPVDKLKALNNLPDGNVKVGQTLLLSEGAAPQPAAKSLPQQNTAVPKQTPVAITQSTAPATPPKEVVSAAKPVAEAPKIQTSPQVADTPQMTANTGNLSTGDNNVTPAYSSPVNAPKEGFFTSLYGKSMNNKPEQTKSGAAMTFKSASGWSDKKYYVLMNDAPTGSIVKVRNGKNELYAKVLWSLGEMKENDGLTFRISTAAAAALGITEQKFDLQVSYFE